MLTTLKQVSTLDALTTRVLLGAEYFLRIVEQHQWVIVSIVPEPMHQDTHAPRRACVVKHVNSLPIGALTDCFYSIHGGQFSALS